MPDQFRCVTCGVVHEGVPLAYRVLKPLDLMRLGRGRLGTIHGEWATLRERDGSERYFLLGQLLFPIDEGDEFAFTVWVEQSAVDMDRILSRWEDDDRVDDPPTEGKLNVTLPGYEDTNGLAVRVHQRPPGMRPFVELTTDDHVLSMYQRDGMPHAEVHRLAAVAKSPRRLRGLFGS